MLFSSMTFLWIFLPAVFVLSRLLPARLHNPLLLAASLLFYAWGEPVYILLMLFSIASNYISGRIIGSIPAPRGRSLALAVGVAANLALLGYFKYFDFAASLLNSVAGRELVGARGIALPIGISFYTFQALSYLIEVRRGSIKPQKNPIKLALYISFFPQLIAGPIVNYRDVAAAIDSRETTPEKTAYGVKRFVWGLAKKVLIANTLASAADGLLAIDFAVIPSSYLWLGMVFYTLQIYYDFSGYSDMAVGLGKMFGFDFLENFNYPYLARSVGEFWRRWHISLSSWFRDYLYIPLGGSRRGLARTCVNLVIVFLFTGLWHGAALCFVAWGLWYALLLVLERLGLGRLLDRCRMGILPRLYTLLAVVVGWVFFRAGSLSRALEGLAVMFSFGPGSYSLPIEMFVGGGVVAAAVLGVFFCGPAQALFPRLRSELFNEERTGPIQTAALTAALLLSIVQLVGGSYNPFIYFRF